MASSSPRPPHFIPSSRLVPRYERLKGPTPHLRELSRERGLELAVTEAAPMPGPGRHLSLIPSVEGEIGKLLLTIPAYVVNDAWLQPVFMDLIRHLSPMTNLVIVTENEQVTAAVKAWPDLDNQIRTVDWVESQKPLLFSMWAEDAYVSARDDTSSIYLIEPLEFFRYGDGTLAELVRDHGIGIRQAQVPLYFQGGNVLVGDEFVLIGEDYPEKTLDYVDTAFPRLTGETRREAVRRVYGEYLGDGRAIVYVGSPYNTPEWQVRMVDIDGRKWIEEVHCGNWRDTKQPIFHIDMFVTLAGRGPDHRYRVLVGDPTMAAADLGIEVWPDAIPVPFQDIADNLETRGFHVIRNPLPMAYYAYDGEAAWSRAKVQGYADQHVTGAAEAMEYMKAQHLQQMPARVWYFASANNALVKSKANGASEVWLPTYGHGAWMDLATTDDHNRKIWQDLGYTVHMLGDFHPFAIRGGAAHCIKKYLARG